jgi:hypothetical protein
MADPILVSTAEQLRTAYNNATTDTTIKVIGDIDFNKGRYSDWEDNFFVTIDNGSAGAITTTLDGSWEDSQGNTQNRTISNIFLYPDKSLFYSSSSRSNILNCTNLTFEVVSNGGRMCNLRKNCTFENCIFNVRLYSHKHVQFYGDMGSDRIDGFLSFKNCVFNFYITTCIVNNIPLFRAKVTTSGSNKYPAIIKSCIFKIRNATDKFITLVDNDGSSLSAKIYNSAIFYNDVGAVQPPYSATKIDKYYYMSNCHSISSLGRKNEDKIMNTYISSFDYYPLPTGFMKPIILAFNYNSNSSTNIPDIISTSFYDGSKIDVYMYNTYYDGAEALVDNYTGCLTKLTTAQCKDPAKLSEIGYLFSEEI